MSKLKIELDSAGVSALLKGSEMQSILQGAASSKALRAGDGFVGAVHIGQRRSYANIYADTNEAKRKNQEMNILLKVISS